ncbi:hypothetical protein [Streptomyces sp. NPDC051162]|uniref:hypothetical protein n=1 Tax=Streptomyces sp. NPDC051162 TaxID=3154747 RepID=UPI0034122AB4
MPEIGAFVVDATRGKVGHVMGCDGLWLRLRPVDGGGEWKAHSDATRTATDAELLSAKVRAANSVGRWGK